MRSGCVWEAFRKRSLATLPGMDTQWQKRPPATGSAHRCDWEAALASGDPAQQWAASCSIAAVVTARDRWTDSTVFHEAAVGAFEAATASRVTDRVVAGIGGARRAVYWERQARVRLVPPVSYREHRWESDLRVERHPIALLPALEETFSGAERRAAPGSRLAPRIGTLLRSAGWRWRARPALVASDAIDDVCIFGRDRAGASLAARYPMLPAVVVSGIVLLLAGSRQRDGLGWPGIVWLESHDGWASAIADTGTQSVVASLVQGKRARPVNAIAVTDPVIAACPSQRRDERARAHARESATTLAVAS